MFKLIKNNYDPKCPLIHFIFLNCELFFIFKFEHTAYVLCKTSTATFTSAFFCQCANKTCILYDNDCLYCLFFILIYKKG